MCKFDVEKYSPIIGAVGNVLTWYNFALFMPFLHILSKSFFPLENEAYGDALSFLALSVGLFVRPLGAAIFGPIGDKFGRQKAISLSILLMAIPTLCIGLLPTYHQIGIWAPILLVFCRALQGISMGGEYTAAMVHLVEKAPIHRRGLYGSWSDAGSQVGVLMGCGVLVWLDSSFTPEAVYAFAWRIPFLCSVVLLPFAFFAPNAKKPSKKTEKEPIISTLVDHKKEVGCTIAVTAFSAVAFYTLLTFFPYFLVSKGMLSLREATLCSTWANVTIVFVVLGAGYLSDYFSRKPFLITGIVGVTVTACLMFLLEIKDFRYWMMLHIAYGFFLSVYYSCRAAFFAESFPTKVRCTAVSLSLSIAQAIFGGLTPVVMSYLTSCSAKITTIVSGIFTTIIGISAKIITVIPIMFVAILAIYALTLLKDRTGEKLM